MSIPIIVRELNLLTLIHFDIVSPLVEFRIILRWYECAEAPGDGAEGLRVAGLSSYLDEDIAEAHRHG